jgi:hypothetical protein
MSRCKKPSKKKEAELQISQLPLPKQSASKSVWLTATFPVRRPANSASILFIEVLMSITRYYTLSMLKSTIRPFLDLAILLFE